MGDVSKKLMNQFATNLNAMLDQQPDSATPAAATAATPGDATTNGSTAAEAPADGAPGVRKIDGPAAAPIELSDVAGSAILKRLLPLVGGLLVLWIVVRRFSRR
jgi:hypothetical protein